MKIKKNKKRIELKEYKKGAYIYGHFLSIVCQNWVLLNIDEEVKQSDDEIYYLVCMPYIGNY